MYIIIHLHTKYVFWLYVAFRRGGGTKTLQNTWSKKRSYLSSLLGWNDCTICTNSNARAIFGSLRFQETCYSYTMVMLCT